MSTGDLLDVEPLELRFPFILKKQTSCFVKLSNKTNKNIAFKALTTDPNKYCVLPNMGIILPHATCEILVTMQAPEQIPPEMRCKDKFKFQSLVADAGAMLKDITPGLFKEAGRHVEEYKLIAVYVFPAQVSSPIAQGSEGSSSKESQLADANLNVPKGKMGMGNLLKVEPLELVFPFKLKKRISCSVQLSNRTNMFIAFKVKTTNPKKYCVRPILGIIMPRSKCDIIVTMQAQEEVPPGMQCKDKFMIQSIVVNPGATVNDISKDKFDGSLHVEENKLKVVYVSPSISLNWERSTSEEGSPARTSTELDGPVQEMLRREESLRRIVGGLVYGTTAVLLMMIFWYLMKMTLSFIWSCVIVLMVKMVTRIVSDSLEDWVVKALVYVVFHFLFQYKNREQ